MNEVFGRLHVTQTYKQLHDLNATTSISFLKNLQATLLPLMKFILFQFMQRRFITIPHEARTQMQNKYCSLSNYILTFHVYFFSYHALFTYTIPKIFHHLMPWCSLFS